MRAGRGGEISEEGGRSRGGETHPFLLIMALLVKVIRI